MKDESHDTAIATPPLGPHRNGLVPAARCRSMGRSRPFPHRCRQRLHRATDHGRDDQAVAAKQGLHGPQERRHGHQDRPGRAGKRRGRPLLGVHRHFAGHFQQGDAAAVAAGCLPKGPGTRRQKRLGLAGAVQGQKQLRRRGPGGRGDNGKTDGMKTISDLAAGYKTGNALAMGMTAEFPKRLDGLIGLQKTYGFEAGRANVRPMQLNLAYNALANGDLDTVVAQATDGQIVALNLRMLADDAGFFPNYAMTPVIRQKVLDAHPGLKAALESISMKLDDATMQRLNSEVDVRRKPIEAVAKSYLEEAGLL